MERGPKSKAEDGRRLKRPIEQPPKVMMMVLRRCQRLGGVKNSLLTQHSLDL